MEIVSTAIGPKTDRQTKMFLRTSHLYGRWQMRLSSSGSIFSASHTFRSELIAFGYYTRTGLKHHKFILTIKCNNGLCMCCTQKKYEKQVQGFAVHSIARSFCLTYQNIVRIKCVLTPQRLFQFSVWFLNFLFLVAAFGHLNKRFLFVNNAEIYWIWTKNLLETH